MTSVKLDRLSDQKIYCRVFPVVHRHGLKGVLQKPVLQIGRRLCRLGSNAKF